MLPCCHASLYFGQPYLGKASRAAKLNVSWTVSDPTSASSCSTKLESLRKSFAFDCTPLTKVCPDADAPMVALRCARTLRSVVFPDPLLSLAAVCLCVNTNVPGTHQSHHLA
jgi:hypothetical protein